MTSKLWWKTLGAIILMFTSSVVVAESDPYPLEYWALRAVTSNVTVSPNGEKLAMMKIDSREGNPVIEIYNVDDLDGKPFRVNADPMEITNYYWVNDEVIVFTLRQQVRDKIEGFNQGVYEGRIAIVDVAEKEIRSFDEVNPFVEQVLPGKKNKIIISFQEGADDSPGQRLSEPFRPRAYWEFDVKTGRKKLLIRGKLSVGNIGFDGDGNPILAQGFDAPKDEIVGYSRPPGGKGWNEIFRLDVNSFETALVDGLDGSGSNSLIVRANKGADTIGLWSVNHTTGSFDELIYQRSDVDVVASIFHSNQWTNPGKVVGAIYGKDKYHRVYFDDAEKALQDQLMAVIPDAYYITIPSRSRDGNTLTVYNRGPHDPGSYYLFSDGKLEHIGSRKPLLESEQLADVKYITWEARDGVKIPGYVTVPNGKPPFPLIVLPHGGPFVAEVVQFDEWGQLLANNGYMVLQPQYRGSRGYGIDFYTSAFRDGGQGGYKMQDDKDDGANYLIEKGLVDADRVAMFGWSYGGYAALIAAARTPQIHQCVVAGAAVADTNHQVNYYRWALRGSGQIEQLRMWDDSVAPIDEVAKVNVPMLIIHGDVDQRVPPIHAKKYVRELDKQKVPYEFEWLEGADHFSSTLFFNHKIQFYRKMLDFLANDCGPGGL